MRIFFIISAFLFFNLNVASAVECTQYFIEKASDYEIAGVTKFNTSIRFGNKYKKYCGMKLDYLSRENFDKVKEARGWMEKAQSEMGKAVKLYEKSANLFKDMHGKCSEKNAGNVLKNYNLLIEKYKKADELYKKYFICYDGLNNLVQNAENNRNASLEKEKNSFDLNSLKTALRGRKTVKNYLLKNDLNGKLAFILHLDPKQVEHYTVGRLLTGAEEKLNSEVENVYKDTAVFVCKVPELRETLNSRGMTVYFASSDYDRSFCMMMSEKACSNLNAVYLKKDCSDDNPLNW